MSLFPELPVINRKESIELLRQDFESGVFNLTQKGMPLVGIVSLYVEDLKIDFKALWDQYESNGYWVYLEVSFRDHKITFTDGDAGIQVSVSGALLEECRDIYSWNETDLFDGKMKTKIKKIINPALFQVVAYLELKSK